MKIITSSWLVSSSFRFKRIFKSPDYVRLINFEISGFIFTLFAVIIGAVIGNFLKIEEKIKNFGDYLYKI